MNNRSVKKVATATESELSAQFEKQQLSVYSGPLPSPKHLADYENIFSGAANRIFEMTEKQLAHRQYLEKKTVDTQSRNSTMGVIFAFILGMTAILGGIYISSCGFSLSGWGTVFVGLAALVGTFVYGKEANKKEILEKQKLINQMSQDK